MINGTALKKYRVCLGLGRNAECENFEYVDCDLA